MKKIFFIITLSVCYFYAFAQKDSVQSIFAWMLSDDFMGKRIVDIDTAIESFQIYNPAYKHYFSNASLGNFGSPCISNVFSERKDNNDFFFINIYYPYLYTWDKTLFVNTKRQFTRLLFTNGGGNTDKEENFEVFHTQNVNQKLNFGLQYNTNLSKGQYRFQRTKRSSFKFFSSYESDFYSNSISINTNNFIVNQNGGIVSDTLLLAKNYQSPEDVLTVYSGTGSQPREFADVTDTIKNLNILLVNNFNLTRYLQKKDTISSDTVIKKTDVGIMLINKFETNKKSFSDLNPQVGLENGFYESIYFNSNRTFDSLYYRKLDNIIRFYIKDNQENTVYLDFSNELIKYTFTSRDEQNKTYFVSGNRKEYPFYYNFFESNLRVSSGAIFEPKNLNLNLYGFLYFGGYKQGNYNLFAKINLPFLNNEETTFSTNIGLSSEKPYYLYQSYYSNYFNWSNNFNPVKKLQLSIKYSHSPKKIGSDLNYSLLRGQMFFDTDGYPKQYVENLSVLELKIFKNFNFWKFSSLNKFALQYVNNETILGLPNVCFYNSTFFKQHIHFNLTGGGFTTILGFDMFYETKYYGYAYMPPISAFIRQIEKKIGGYPIVDIFLNIKLKRALFFLKFEHVNSGLLERNYYSILHYPRNERMFKTGISWNFYD